MSLPQDTRHSLVHISRVEAVNGYENARKLGDLPRFGVIVFFPYCCAPIVGILLSLCSDFASDVLLPRVLTLIFFRVSA